MTLFQQIDRMKYIHYLIRREHTGNPEHFARKLQLSKRQTFQYFRGNANIGFRYSL